MADSSVSFKRAHDDSPSQGEIVVELDAARKRIAERGLEFTVLRDVTLVITHGQRVCIDGAHGAGKSALLAVVALLTSLSEGAYALEGVDTVGADKRALERLRRERIGVVLDDPMLLDELTCYENIALRVPKRPDRDALVRDALARHGLADKAQRPARHLVRDDRCALAIARAAVTDPAVLILDDPTAHLDARASARIEELIRNAMPSARAVLMSSHDERLRACCSRRITLADGAIVEDTALK